MKKSNFIKLFSIVLLFFMTISVFAQESQSPTKPQFKKHEFNVSVGLFPVVGIFSFFGAVNPNPSPNYYISERSQYGLLLGAFNVEYNYNLSSKFSTGYALSYSMIKTRNSHSTRYYNMFYNQLFLKFIYYNKNKIDLYSTLYLGYTFGLAVEYPGSDFFKSKLINFNSQICFLGINYSKDYFVELGFGNQGIVKLGYKF